VRHFACMHQAGLPGRPARRPALFWSLSSLRGAQAVRPRLSVLDGECGASTSGRGGAGGAAAARARGCSSAEDSWDLDDGGYTPFPANLPTAQPGAGEPWRGMDDGGYTPFPANVPAAQPGAGGAGEPWRGGAGAPGRAEQPGYELWQCSNSLHYSTASSGDLWRTLTNVRPRPRPACCAAPGAVACGLGAAWDRALQRLPGPCIR